MRQGKRGGILRVKGKKGTGRPAEKGSKMWERAGIYVKRTRHGKKGYEGKKRTPALVSCHGVKVSCDYDVVTTSCFEADGCVRTTTETSGCGGLNFGAEALCMIRGSAPSGHTICRSLFPVLRDYDGGKYKFKEGAP